MMQTVPRAADLMAIPAALRARPQWVGWREELREGRPTKVPYRADGAGRASHSNPSTWCSFADALVTMPRYDGVGFVFSEGDPYCGIDFDHCRGEDGQIVPEVLQTVQLLGSYTEWSPSGKGLHVIVEAHLPGPGRRHGGIEMYDRSRFFTMTGARVGEPTAIRPAQTAVEALYARLVSATELQAAQQPYAASALTDGEVIAKARKATNGRKFSSLFDGGDLAAYGDDDSAADLALCSLLAFWTQDETQLDRLMRQSALMRPKWERRDYSRRTIAAALHRADVWTPDDGARAALSNGHQTTEAASTATTPELTDTGNADRFVHAYADELRYRIYGERTGSWLVWDGMRWAVTAQGDLYERGKRITRAMLAEAATLGDDACKALGKHALKAQQAERLHAMVLLSQGPLGAWSDTFDSDHWVLNCRNGTLDLRTATLQPHAPADSITYVTRESFHPDALCPVWDAFLAHVLPDTDVRVFMQRALGYALTGTTREQCLFFLHGSGANGKSTLLNAVRGALGDYAAHTPSETFLAKREGAATNDLAALAGKRMVTTVEVADGRRLAEALVKELTGGDPLTVRFLNKEFFTYVPAFKVFLGANHKPVIRGQDLGIWRRIHLVPFTVTIPEGERDEQLGEKLAAEGAGILAWLLRGCLDWQRHGLQAPAAVRQATASYRSEMDVLAEFLDECCILGPQARVERKALYMAYTTWCEQCHDRPLSQPAFARQIGEREFKEAKIHGSRHWVGISVVSPARAVVEEETF